MDDAPEADVAADIRTIRFEIESIKRTQHLLLRRDAQEILSRILIPLFEDKANSLMASVYLYIDSNRSQAEVVEAMKSDGVRISQSTVSRRMTTLADQGLIEQVEVKGRGVTWQKNPEIELGLRLSEELRRRAIE